MKVWPIYFLLSILILIGADAYSQISNDIYIEYFNYDVDFSEQDWPDVLKNPENSKAEYDNLLSRFFEKGYFEASIDTVIQWDQGKTRTIVYVGPKYFLGTLKNLNVSPKIYSRYFSDQGMDWVDFNQSKIFAQQYYQDSGYFKAEVYLKDIFIEDNIVNGSINVDKGFIHRIDTVINTGDLQINNKYLESVIGIKKGDVFIESDLKSISSKIAGLKFAMLTKEAEIIFNGDKVSIKMEITRKKVNNAEFVLGVIPSQNNSVSIHGLAEIKLYNSFKRGSEINFNWERLKKRTQEINLGVSYPFLFNLPISIDGKFHLYKQDSLWVNTRTRIGMKYLKTSNHRSGVFFGINSSRVLDYDTMNLHVDILPEKVDYNELEFGGTYQLSNLDDPIIPRRGFFTLFELSFGLKSYDTNEKVAAYYRNHSNENENKYEDIDLKTSSLSFKTRADKYWPISESGVIRTALNFEYKTSENGFKNEMLRVGGINSFRGVEERSILANTIIYTNLEYRFIFARGSFLSMFTDVGYFAGSNSNDKTVVSFGPGIFLNTKAGSFRLITALSSYYEPFSFRNTNVHVGYISRF